jgi:hypothetical protein
LRREYTSPHHDLALQATTRGQRMP